MVIHKHSMDFNVVSQGPDKCKRWSSQRKGSSGTLTRGRWRPLLLSLQKAWESVHFWKMFGFFSFHSSIWLKANMELCLDVLLLRLLKDCQDLSMESMWKGPWLRSHPTPQVGQSVQCVLSTVFNTQHYQLGVLWSLRMCSQRTHSWEAVVARTRVIIQSLPNSLVSKKNSHHQEIPEWRLKSTRPGRFSYQPLFLAGLLKTWT